MKRTKLQRRTPLRVRHLQLVTEPGRDTWKAPVAGVCACGCGTWARRLERHHVVLEQIVRRAGGDPWALENSMLLAPDCHRQHHAAFRKIGMNRVPDAALLFARDLLGDAAADYFLRRYAPSAEDLSGRAA